MTKNKSQVVIAPVPQFETFYKRLKERAANSKPNSQIRRNLHNLQKLLINMQNPDFRGYNDMPLERDLTGYRKVYVDSDKSYRDPTDGAKKPSHRLIYEEYMFQGKLYRSPIAFATRDKVYDIAKLIINDIELYDSMGLIANSQYKDNKLLAQYLDEHPSLKSKFAKYLLDSTISKTNTDTTPSNSITLDTSKLKHSISQQISSQPPEQSTTYENP